MFYYCLRFTDEETERAQGQTSITCKWQTWCEGCIVTLMCICITSDLITSQESFVNVMHEYCLYPMDCNLLRNIFFELPQKIDSVSSEQGILHMLIDKSSGLPSLRQFPVPLLGFPRVHQALPLEMVHSPREVVSIFCCYSRF